MRVVLSTRNGHVCEAVVNQQFAFLSVHVDYHPLSRLSLATVAGDCVAIVKVRVLADVESDFVAWVHSDSKIAVRIDVFDSAEITISNVQLA
jgi:negative regulator of sigma E activity